MVSKNKIATIMMGFLAIVFAFITYAPTFKPTKSYADSQPTPTIQSLKVASISDSHIFSLEMTGDNASYHNTVQSDRKMLTESEAILDSALQDIATQNPDILLISGDLTKDGEYLGHQLLASKLADFEATTGVKVYVINGNHDVNNSLAVDYSSGTKTPTQKTTTQDFKQIYNDFGYGEAVAVFEPTTTRQGTLSYVARPAEGFTILAVDTGKYTSDVTTKQTDEHETSGMVSDELLAWITQQTFLARGRGDTVIVMQHHGVVPHFDGQPDIMKAYLLDNYLTVAPAYADAGIGFVFTGHAHTNDISHYTSTLGNTLYDIQTGSLLTYPTPYRIVDFVRNYDQTQRSATTQADIQTRHIDQLTFEDETGATQTISDFQQYAKSKATINENMAYLIANNKANGNFSEFILKELGNKPLRDTLDETLVAAAPALVYIGINVDPENPMETLVEMAFKMYFAEPIIIPVPTAMFGDAFNEMSGVLPIPEEIEIIIYYDDVNRRVVADPITPMLENLTTAQIAALNFYLIYTQGVTLDEFVESFILYSSVEDVAGEFYSVLDQFDALLADEAFMDIVVRQFVADILATEYYLDGDYYTLEQIATDIYQIHTAGDEVTPAYIQEFRELAQGEGGNDWFLETTIFPATANALDLFFAVIEIDLANIIQGQIFTQMGYDEYKVPVLSVMGMMGMTSLSLIQNMYPMYTQMGGMLGGTGEGGESGETLDETLTKYLNGMLSMLDDTTPDNNTQLSYTQSDLILTVTFKVTGRADVVKNVYYGDALTSIPSLDERVGYTASWDVQDFSCITSNMVVNAVYTPIPLTITFKAEGFDDIIKQVGYGQTLTDIPEVPFKEGYEGVWDRTDFFELSDDVVVNAVYTKVDGGDDDKDGCGCGGCSGCGCGTLETTSGIGLFTSLTLACGAILFVKRKKEPTK